MLAGVLTLGIAMEKTGAALVLSDILISVVGVSGPVALIAALFFLTMVLANVMSNATTAVLLVPIALVAADSLGLSPRPFLMAVTSAAALSFMTPVAYQRNTPYLRPGKIQIC